MSLLIYWCGVKKYAITIKMCFYPHGVLFVRGTQRPNLSKEARSVLK